ncbi:MAG: imidazoleglycerol-phosphate dehydratase HisB [Candidatus Latescibacterota bacterium]|jgi:imidazoleglycerol-phosphate dehydratase
MGDTRQAQIQRRTTETDIDLTFVVDGAGASSINTGVGFFDHMLTAFSRHGLFDLTLSCKGDLEVDAHHTVEDVGICLGQAVAEALGDKAGIERFGSAYVPMDEALARAVIDLSGRSCLVMQAAFRDETVGGLAVALVPEFFRALADNGRMNVHVDLLRGTNDHHSIEAIFKATGRALDAATGRSDRVRGVPSTKGTL